MKRCRYKTRTWRKSSRRWFKKVVDLLEIEGESRFKIKAYRDAARTVGGHSRTATSARG